MSDRVNGVVKWFNANKGYGFISNQEGEDLFVHYSSIRENGGYRSLEEGQEVEFTKGEGKKGPQAQDVVVLQLFEFPAGQKGQNAIQRYTALFHESPKQLKLSKPKAIKNERGDAHQYRLFLNQNDKVMKGKQNEYLYW